MIVDEACSGEETAMCLRVIYIEWVMRSDALDHNDVEGIPLSVVLQACHDLCEVFASMCHVGIEVVTQHIGLGGKEQS